MLWLLLQSMLTEHEAVEERRQEEGKSQGGAERRGGARVGQRMSRLHQNTSPSHLAPGANSGGAGRRAEGLAATPSGEGEGAEGGAGGEGARVTRGARATRSKFSAPRGRETNTSWGRALHRGASQKGALSVIRHIIYDIL